MCCLTYKNCLVITKKKTVNNKSKISEALIRIILAYIIVARQTHLGSHRFHLYSTELQEEYSPTLMPVMYINPLYNDGRITSKCLT